jgi:hypothetical protein
MIGLVRDGLVGDQPRYGTRTDLEQAVRDDPDMENLHSYRSYVLPGGSPKPFSSALIWDFLICIAFSQCDIRKHYLGRGRHNGPHIPEETLACAGFIVSLATI